MAQKRVTFTLMPANDSFDRIQTILDEKQRAIFLSEMERTMPSVGIFDEPTRCFKFNLEWCKLVVGWLLWMADVAFWKDAQDESYSAIRQMLIALEGEPCNAQSENIVNDVRINGCNLEALIDGIWVDKGSVLNCVTAITNPMQTQINSNIANIATNANAISANALNIASNDVDIAALQTKDTDLQAQITSNDNDITALQAKDADHDNDLFILSNYVTNHLARIIALENSDIVQTNDINQLEVSVQQHNLTIDNHETRITTLENAGGGGGGQNIKTTSYAHQIPFNITNQTIDFFDGVTIQHDFTYPNAMIIIEFRGRHGSSSGIAKFRAKLGTLAGLLETWTEGLTPMSLQVNQFFENIQPGLTDITLQHKSSGVNYPSIIPDNQMMQFVIIEYSDAVVVTPPAAVTFDAGGLAYTNTGIGIVSPVGNAGNAVQATALDYGGGAITIEFNTESGLQETITDIVVDIYTTQPERTLLDFYIDNVFVGGNGQLTGLPASQWYTYRLAVEETFTELPKLGTTIKVVSYNNAIGSPAIDDLRLDNLYTEVS